MAKSGWLQSFYLRLTQSLQFKFITNLLTQRAGKERQNRTQSQIISEMTFKLTESFSAL